MTGTFAISRKTIKRDYMRFITIYSQQKLQIVTINLCHYRQADNHYLIPLIATDSTIIRWNRKNKISVGSMAMTEAAMIKA